MLLVNQCSQSLSEICGQKRWRGVQILSHSSKCQRHKDTNIRVNGVNMGDELTKRLSEASYFWQICICFKTHSCQQAIEELRKSHEVWFSKKHVLSIPFIHIPPNIPTHMILTCIYHCEMCAQHPQAKISYPWRIYSDLPAASPAQSGLHRGSAELLESPLHFFFWGLLI